MMGHPDVFAQHGTTTALGHPEHSSQSIISYWDIQTTWTSHTRAFTSPTIDMILGKVDTTFTDIDDVNKRQTVILGETG